MRGSLLPARRPVATLAVVALIAGGFMVGAFTAPAAMAVPGPAIARPSDVVTADALPTVQVNGVVWSQAVVGNTVYAGGGFSQSRPAGAAAGTNETPRSNLLAYDITTGNLITSFAPVVNGQILSVAASPDGTRVYIAGEFTSVNGVTRNRVAAFNTATGALITTFNPNIGSRVKSVVATNSTVYVGGMFTAANGQPRSKLAAYQASNGALTAWAPSADYTVNALVMVPDGSRLIVGGAFQNINGQPAYGLAAVSSDTGAVIPWAANQTVRNAGPNAAILGLSTDGVFVYGNGYVYGTGGNLEGAFAAEANSGAIRWIEDCHGDTYGTFAVGESVYTVSHAHYCGNMGGYGESLPGSTFVRRALAFTKQPTGTINPDPRGYPNWVGQPSPSLISWYPEMASGTYTGQNQAAWTVTGNATYVVLGGEFPTVNGIGQQGLVRFAVKQAAPSKRGPQLGGGKFVPTLNSFSPGTIRVAFQANYDQDTKQLNYRIARNGVTVHETTAASSFWDRPIVSFTDTGLTPGVEYGYRIFVNDGDGNEVAGDTVRLVAGATGTIGSYADTILQQGVSLYWRLGEATGSTAIDMAGVNNGVTGSGVTRGVAGAIAGDSNTASTFNGTSTGRLYSPTQMPSPTSYTASVWFKTTTSSGGKILGFGDSQTGNSVLADRHIYLDNSGRLNFGVAPRGTVTLTSPKTYRDGQWHQAVSTMGADGLRLYVDGQQVAARADITSGEDIFGYWRVGGDTIDTTWPNRPTSTFFNGAIDDVAIFPTVLTAAQIATQWSVSRGAPTNTPPVSAFTVAVTALTASFDASGSTDADGTIASHAWDFGDGTAGTGVGPSHAFPASGTYQVKLTVTDNGGTSTAITKQVTVTSPGNVAPVAAFSAPTSGLRVDVDGSASTDSDGTVQSHAWDFGDGGTATGATASHDYATAGTYAVALTVTDDKGATNAVTKQVTVTAPGVPSAIAVDSFTRTVTNGWGSAATGGAWTANGNGTLFGVDGVAGSMRMAAAGAGPTQLLSVSAANLAGTVDLALDKVPAGNGVHGIVMLRKVGSSDYRVKVRLAPTSTAIQISKVVANAETPLLTQNVSGLTYQAGDTLRLSFQITGPAAGPATISAKVWKVGAAEPAAWQATTADSTTALRDPGAFGLQGYLGSTATNAPVTARFDNLNITAVPVP